MSNKIRYPNINGHSEAVQLTQVKSYLHQLVDQLNWAITSVEKQASGANNVTEVRTGSTTNTTPQGTFNSIKALIIKSADIVNAYYDVISKRLEGVYVAQSDFGVYTEETAQDIEANSTSIESIYTNLQQISTDIENVESSIIDVNAHIKTGLLYYDAEGIPVYGLEIGQRTEHDGEEVFNKYARFTSDKLSFYDQNDNEVAYISDKKLYINHVEVTGSLRMGGFQDFVQPDGGTVTKWVGTGG